MKTYLFHVDGMHCKACTLLIETELGETPDVQRVTAHLSSNTVKVEGDFGDMSAEAIAAKLSLPLKKHGYTLSLEKQTVVKKWSDFKSAVPIALGFAVLFVLLQKMGLINLVQGNNVTYGTAFVIGIIASLSTCMAVVGGLVLSMSATFAKEGDRVRPQVLFHIGRIGAFFVLGGVIGALGSAFALNATATFVMSFVIAIVMFILGLNLLEVFPWAKRLQPSVPQFLSRHTLAVSKWNHAITPVAVGIATFFLPCGFTQSMQLYTLGTGSFLTGGLTMLAFALGTLPVLALISFSSLSIKNSPKAGVFFKSAGLIVIMFAIFNLLTSLTAIGLVPPLFNF